MFDPMRARLASSCSRKGMSEAAIDAICVGDTSISSRKVEDSKVNLDNNDVVYLTAELEEGKMIAQGNAPLNPDGTFIRTSTNSITPSPSAVIWVRLSRIS